MIGDARCALTELRVAECAHCREHTAPDPYVGVAISRFRVASYSSKCALFLEEHRCEPGDDIGQAVLEDGTVVGWVCPVCVTAITGGQ